MPHWLLACPNDFLCMADAVVLPMCVYVCVVLWLQGVFRFFASCVLKCVLDFGCHEHFRVDMEVCGLRRKFENKLAFCSSSTLTAHSPNTFEITTVYRLLRLDAAAGTACALAQVVILTPLQIANDSLRHCASQ